MTAAQSADLEDLVAKLLSGAEDPKVVKYLTTVEVAGELRTPVETVRYWRHVGRGPKSFKVGRRVLYARADVDAWIAEAREGMAVT